MEGSHPRFKWTVALIFAICVIAGILAWKERNRSSEVVIPNAPPRSVEEVAGDWRSDVTRLMAEYDRTQDARAAEQGFLALHVVDQDRDLHLKFVLAFHALGESKPEGRAELAEARRRFESASPVIR